ncbi:hypothetical protein STA3757_31200 [Stanieria sp. NIES-3757]|nr:hypothetical protein STA3757_31200 [Stanieria sp. NIES-3757]
MFDLGFIFGAADLVSDFAGVKQRQARQIKFFRYKEGNLGIAFFDNQTIHGEYWIENIPVPATYEMKFKSSGFNLDTKYELQFFGLQPFNAAHQVLQTPAIQKRILETIFNNI